MPLRLTCGETKAVGNSEICLEDLWEETSQLWSCTFAWYSLSTSLQKGGCLGSAFPAAGLIPEIPFLVHSLNNLDLRESSPVLFTVALNP